MKGELTPVDGAIRKHRHLKIASFTQHSAEMLDEDSSALKWMIGQFPVEYEDEDRDARKAAGQHENKMRGRLAQFGVSGKESTTPMRFLSDGQKSRICFAHAATCKAHIILLDEPTNHLDIASIDALADALEPVSFLDLNRSLIDRELQRMLATRRSGPHAENMLADVGAIAPRIR